MLLPVDKLDRLLLVSARLRRTPIEAPADNVGLPLWSVPLPWPCSNQEYENIWRGV